MPNSSRSLKVLSLAAMGATALKLTPKRRVHHEAHCSVEEVANVQGTEERLKRCAFLGGGNFGAVYECHRDTVTKVPRNPEAYKDSRHERDMNTMVQTKMAQKKAQIDWPVAKMTACKTIKDAQGNELALTTFEKGATLDDDQVRAWEIAKKLKYFKEMAKNLDTLHDMGIVHSDVKIENSVLGKDRRALLIDLGLALDLDGHRTIKPVGGTHLSRNVCKRYTVSPASDFYSLGVEMAHMFFKDLYDESVNKYEAQENSFFSSEQWRFIEDEVSAELESRVLHEDSFDDLLRDLVIDMLRGDGQTWYDPPVFLNAQHWSDLWNGVESEKEFANRIQKIIEVFYSGQTY